MSTETIIIALYGGTGRTGRHVVRYALEKGYKVQMLARDPTKVDIQHNHLTVFEGDFGNKEAIQQVIKGATHVICCAGGPSNPKEYPQDLMLNFIQLLYPLLLAEPSVKVFLYQAGRFSAAPEQPPTRLTTFLRYTLGYLLGFEPIVQDNERVTFYIAEQHTNKQLHFDFIITRPGYLVELKEEGAEVEDVVAEYVNFPVLSFPALAKFTVEAIHDTSLYGTYPFLAAKAK
jgi:nucleoside-diphosphate-sugar epimerase